ncbi:MAG: hypothetical protein DMF77_25355 [Acidobacteria bacterium]|nr:MAG: hypothetical protein DMF77_25355 [Acidobacteriota bacterium]
MYWSVVGRRLIGRSVPLLMATLLLAFGCTPTPKPVVPANAPSPDIAQLWSEPTDFAARDLFYGAGGPDLMPLPKSVFTLIAKDDKGFSPGYDVRDLPGRKWSVKYGPEAQSEVVASRITWAVGYRQPPTYHVADWQLVGADIAPDAAPAGRFRPELPGWQYRGTWSWARNPFVGTQPYRGLIVLMHVLSNWDLLDQNTALYAVDPPVRGASVVYVVRDLGGALGRAKGLPVSGSRNDIDDFEEQGFIKGVGKDGYVRFDDTRWRHEKLYRHITPADIRWTCDLLRRLSPRQWEDAFRAARYEPALANRFIRRLQEKVQMGLMLGGAPDERSARVGRP